MDDLLVELSSLKQLRRNLTAQQYKTAKNRVEGKIQTLLAKEAEKKRALAVKKIKDAEAKKIKAAKTIKLAVKDRKKLSVLFEARFESNYSLESTLNKAWRAAKGKSNIITIVTRRNPNRKDFEIKWDTVPMNSKEFNHEFVVYNEGGGYHWIVEKGDKIAMIAETSIPAQRLYQVFRDGISHCVFTPILNRLYEDHENSESKEVIKRLTQRIAKMNKLELQYSEGVPEDKMEEVAKASGFKISIHDVLGNETAIYNKNQNKTLRFTNTRENHLDIGHIALDEKTEKVHQDEVIYVWEEAVKNNEFYMIEGDLTEGLPRKVRTLTCCVEVYDPNKAYYDALNSKIDLNKYKFNATKNPDVNAFIKAGRIINAWATPLSDEKPTGHLDMPKAYTQFKKCSHYMGFLGVIHQWRSGSFDRAFIEDHIGIYRFKVLKCENELFTKLGLGSTHILPSPEILYFMDNGVEMELDAGVFGSRMDFEFPDEMLVDRRYCIWSGRLSMEHKFRKYTFSSSKRWARHLKHQFGNDASYWEDKGVTSVNVPIESVATSHHILAFITSYVRIQMMEAMKKFKVEQLCQVVLDGIYFTGEKPMGLEWFKEKEIKEQCSVSFGWYSQEEIEIAWTPVRFSENTLLTGQGGCGKTYGVLTDDCLNKILFVTPSHVLGADVREKYKVPYTTINRLLGKECTIWKQDHFYPPVVLVDEITQIPAEWIDEVFVQYPDSLIILAGDVTSSGQWFQTRNGCPGNYSNIWKPTCTVEDISGDRRSRDDDLRQLKLRIREEMVRIFIDGDSGEAEQMIGWAKQNLKQVPFFDVPSMFVSGIDKAKENIGLEPIFHMSSKFIKGDTCIAGTHDTNNKLNLLGVVSGYYKAGGHISDCEKEGYTERGSFTIHSYQGKTIEEGKIFIFLDDMFEYSMLYTAVSRAVNYSQLVFVS